MCKFYCYRLILNNVLKKFHPRLVYIGVFILLIIGSALIADWQTIGKDSCRIFSPFHYQNSQSESATCIHYKSQTLHDYCERIHSAKQDNNMTQLASELCQATQGCHLNKYSVITNSLCLHCPAICRHVQHSLSFIQFTLGAAIFVFALPAGDVCMWVLISNNLLAHEQVKIATKNKWIYI